MPPDLILDCLAYLNESGQEMRAKVEHWCAQNSGSHNLEGLEKMRSILAEIFAPLGGEIEFLKSSIPPPHSTGGSLRIQKHLTAPIQILLSGHMDTVYGPDSPFQRCMETRLGVLNGPGVADMKGGLVVMHKVLETLESSPWAGQLGWTVLITGDEETGSLGSEQILTETARGKDLALVFECAQPGGNLVGCRKGGGEFQIVVKGREAHTGRDFHAGRNAIVLLAECIQRVATLNEGYPGFCINVGVVSGGTATNIVPGQAECGINLRIPPRQHPDELLAAIQAICDELGSREGFELKLEGRIIRQAMELTSLRSYWIEAFQETARMEGLELGIKDTGGGSDGNVLHASGVPVLDGIALRGGKLHSPDEFLELDSLVERARLISRFLLRLAKGEIGFPPEIAGRSV